jgi:hypothetical protein
MSRRGAYAAVAAGATILAALVVAATGPAVPILSRPAASETAPARPTLTFLTSSPEATLSSATTTGTPAPPSIVLVVLVQAILALTFLAFIAVVIQLIASLIRRPRLQRHAEPTFEAPEVPEELLATAEERMRLVLTGDPRNAIVAAWLNLETSAAQAGIPRDPAETSTEYTSRVIGSWDVDRVRLADLATLYREARFSTHQLGEDLRRRAADDLETLHADLERVARTQAETSPASEEAGHGR